MMIRRKQPLYLDYAATTPVDPEVAAAMHACLMFDGNFANPASRAHRFGWHAEEAVDIARQQIAELVNADPREIVFTSGATEANNLAIKGAAQAYADKGRHIVTVNTEHKAVLDVCTWLETQGYEVTRLSVDADGLVSPQQLAEALRDDTVLASIMHVNNEIGVIQNIAALGELCRQRNVLFHVDAVQSVGKLPIDLSTLAVDLMSFSAHKVYGPKGVGALFVRRRPSVNVAAQIHGGGHERGMRSGTLATHQIVGMGASFALAAARMQDDHKTQQLLRDRLWQGLQAIPGIRLNGSWTQRLYNNLNVSIAGVDGETLLNALGDIAVSSGSACTSASVLPSHVLSALGVEASLAHASMRFSVGRYTTMDDIDYTVARVTEVVNQLRQS